MNTVKHHKDFKSPSQTSSTTYQLVLGTALALLLVLPTSVSADQRFMNDVLEEFALILGEHSPGASCPCDHQSVTSGEDGCWMATVGGDYTHSSASESTCETLGGSSMKCCYKSGSSSTNMNAGSSCS